MAAHSKDGKHDSGQTAVPKSYKGKHQMTGEHGLRVPEGKTSVWTILSRNRGGR